MIKNHKNKFVLIMLFISGILSAQIKQGNVSYLSSQNVYVRFDNTEGIVVSDTLYFEEAGKLVPCVIVKYLSSSSAAGLRICEGTIEVGDQIIAKIKEAEKPEENLDDLKNDEMKDSEEILAETKEQIVEPGLKPEVKGRISISSYSNLSNIDRRADYQRWRYLFSINAKNINGLPLTLNNYVTFSYRPDQWNRIQGNIGKALRVYELSLDYDLSYKTKFSFGRKNNLRISNLGSIDGLQFQTKFGRFETGFVVGSRPNFSDYGYNFKMFQYGIYISRTDTIGSGTIQNTIGGFEQTNDFNTDRRFIYIQHVNNSIKNINIFASSEIDLYKRKKGTEENTFSLTSLYLSARYNPSRYISLSASYDARKNIVYYETFKNYADSLLESETRQGLRLTCNIRPMNYLNIGIHYGYRFKNSDVESTNNYGGYISYSNIPFVKSSFTVSYNKLNTSYLNGDIISFRLYKYLVPEFLNTGLSYKQVKYDYKTMSYSLKQNIYTLDLTFQLFTKIFLSANFEGTYEGIRSYNRIYMNLTTRF